jgi:hypothetical protein
MRLLATVAIVSALSVIMACSEKKEPQVDLRQGQQELHEALDQLDKAVEEMVKDGETIPKGE